MRTLLFVLLLLGMSLSKPAAAGISEAKSCGALLPDNARLIFDTVLPKMKPGIDARSTIRSTVVGLVRSGKLSQSTAPAEAMAASECLRKLEQ